jgi:predicted transposase/invertase (TIGR01784 family)
MQLERQSFFAKRALYYTSKAYVGQIDKAVNYPKLNQVIFIGIMDFIFFGGDDYICRHLILDEKTHKQVLKDLEFNFIELPKFHKTEHELENTMEKWIYFLKHADDLQVIPKELSETKEIAEAFEVVEQHNWTKKELEYYESWEMRRASEINAIEAAKMMGEEQGIEKGRKEEKIEIAKNLLALELDIEKIIQATGLSAEEIEKLKKS